MIHLSGSESLVPGSDKAGIVISGDLSIIRTGDYRFFPGEASLRLDGQGISDDPIRLEAGTHEFELEEVRGSGPLRIEVSWEGPGFAREPMPWHVFSHRDESRGGPDGRQLFEDLGCSNCHASDSHSIEKRPGPVLTGVASRVRANWIAHWLADPRAFRSWSTMPQVLTPDQQADVAAFLSALGAAPQKELQIRKSSTESGRTAFQALGCWACHGADLPLESQGSKWFPSELRAFLQDPLRLVPDGRMPSFRLNSDEALELAGYLGLSSSPAFEQPLRKGDPDRGRELVTTSGCLACHELDGLESTAVAPPLLDLDATNGCLADAVPANVPSYRWRRGEQAALRSFVTEYQSRPDKASAPVFDLQRRLRQLRCGACHEVDGTPAHSWLPESAPPLTGVGSKLRPSWIAHAVGTDSAVLDWQELRMPSFGDEHASWLARAFAKASGVDPDAAEELVDAGLAADGIARLGVDGTKGGMGCIGCHGWGPHPSLGELGPNLREAAMRLRWPWFKVWMHGPDRILPGTSMPNYFGGATSEDSEPALAALWSALGPADDLALPFGFGDVTSDSAETQPVPTDRAIVVRWDMPEASPAAIAVGLPGGLSYCFDAGESRLRYAWRGGFLDMSRTLYNKKNRETNLTETAEIIGDIFFREGPYPLRFGASGRIPQRQFLGYRYQGQVPEFHYTVDGIDVYERIEAIDDGIARHFRLEAVDEPIQFVRADAEGVQIESSLDGDVVTPGKSVEFEVRIRVAP